MLTGLLAILSGGCGSIDLVLFGLGLLLLNLQILLLYVRIFLRLEINNILGITFLRQCTRSMK